jgi:calcium permeable stress-gated cation channel
LPRNPFHWFKDIIREPNSTVLNFNGPDAYFFIRFVRLALILFAPFWFLTWAILMPIAATGGYGQAGLNMFIIGNVSAAHQDRLAAYIILGVLFFGLCYKIFLLNRNNLITCIIVWILYNLHKEYEHFFTVRQAYLSSPEHLASARSRTVMISNVPSNVMSEAALRDLAGAVVTGDAVEQVWLSRKVKNLEKIFDARNKECLQLEAGETEIQALAAKRVRKGKVSAEGDGAEEGDLWLRYIPTKKRPTHRLGLPLISKKVDTMDYSPSFIREQNQLLETERANVKEAPLGNTAFIRFASQASAHRFCQLVQKQPGARRITSDVDVIPEEVKSSLLLINQTFF